MNGIRFFLLALSFGICFAQGQTGNSILFVSDTQAPLWIETLRLRENNNEQATDKIFSAIAQESSAVALFHLGDITAVGMLDGYWKTFDTARSLLNIPVYPAFGNHEYFFIASLGKEQMLKRFPSLEPSWYCTRIGNIAVILLNSNFSKLSEKEIAAQQQWYTHQLSQLDQDSTVTAIIVGCHHSPFTNSSIVNSNDDVQFNFVKPFTRSVKTKLFISGHAHTYEHFHFDGKEFLVIGGGGGLLHPLKDSDNREWNDISPREAKRRFFHYVLCAIENDRTVLSIKMLKEDFSEFETVETILIPYK